MYLRNIMVLSIVVLAIILLIISFTRKKCLIILTVIALIVVGAVVFYWLFNYGTPGKKAIKDDDIINYKDYIIVKEPYSTGTGWIITGGSTQYKMQIEKKDVLLTGEQIPKAKIGTNVNSFLCVVEYKGIVEHDAFFEGVQCFEVKEWYPVYPVVRNSLFPDLILPKDYLSDKELRHY